MMMSFTFFAKVMFKYIQPHQRDVTNLLAAAVQACHDMVLLPSVLFFNLILLSR